MLATCNTRQTRHVDAMSVGRMRQQFLGRSSLQYLGLCSDESTEQQCDCGRWNRVRQRP